MSSIQHYTPKLRMNPKDCIITSDGKDYIILKKYEMQNFTSQERTDCVIADFAKIVKDNTGVEFFKNNFYAQM